MKTVIEMAREAGFLMENSAAIQAAERFAELVRADAIADAVEREREACAKEVENYALGYAEPVWAFKVASIIRDRGNR